MRKPTKREQFEAVMAEREWTAVHAAEWEFLRQSFSETSLREWLRDEGVPIDQPYRGVETKTLKGLEESLGLMTEVYEREAGLRKACRAVVIAAKDRTRFAAKNPKVEEAKREVKAEMVQWMLVWLDDPGMFRVWVRARKPMVFFLNA